MKYLKLTLINSGGEYSFGFVTEEEEVNLLNEKIDAEEVNLHNYSDDDSIEVSFFMYEDILHTFGPGIDGASLMIEEFKDKEYSELKEDIKSLEKLENYYKYNISLDNPYFNPEKEDLDENTLVFGGFYVEKNIHFSVGLELKDEDEFDEKNLFYGTINMDETLSQDEIVTNAYYISKENQDKILKLYECDINEGDNKKELVIEAIQELIYCLDNQADSTELKKANQVKEILEKSSLELIDDIEGQGFSKWDYVRVLDHTGEEIFER